MAKTKTKMPKLPSLATEREYREYQNQLIQYQNEQLGRQKAKIAALQRKNKHLQDLLFSTADVAARITALAAEPQRWIEDLGARDEDYSARDRAERASIADED